MPLQGSGTSSQKKENIIYDDIDRLSQAELNDVISQQISYDQSGLMHYILKDHLGSYNVIADEQEINWNNSALMPGARTVTLPEKFG